MKYLPLLFLLLFNLLFADTIIEKEPNNDFDSANFVLIQNMVEGNLNSSSDKIDVFKITPKTTGKLYIYTTDAIKDIDLYVYDENKNLIAYDNSSYDNVSLTVNVEANKSYYIVLSLYEAGNTDYKLHFFPFNNTATFKPIFNKNLNGSINVIGNHNICLTKGGSSCVDPGDADNNDVYQNYINVDSEAIERGYINSSEADLNLKKDDKIIKAYLFWQGRIKTDNPLTSYSVANANKVELKTPTTNGYVEIDANLTSFNWYYGSDGVFDYGAYADVTDYVKNSGKYYLANLQVSEGANTGGGWSLVVITKNPYDQFNKIVVYEGFQAIYNQLGYPDSVTQTLSGFFTPTTGTVNASFILFANETDRSLNDYVTLTDKSGNPHKLTNVLNPPDNVLNCTISKFGNNVTNRLPNYENTLGTDIDEFNVSDIFNNEQTETQITIKSDGDRIFLNMFAISVQLYVPKVCYYDFGLYDKNGNLIPPGSKLLVGDTFQVKFKVKNDENETAKNVYVIYPFDENNNTKYENNSTYVKNVLQSYYEHFDDNTTKGHLGVYVDDKSLSIGILGDENDEFISFYENPDYVAGIEYNVTLKNEGNLSFIYYTDYNYTLGNTEYTYHGILPKCNEFNNNYKIYLNNPGIFNVVEPSFNSNIDPLDENDPLNAIFTKIMNKTFTMKVIRLDDDKKTLKKYKGLVEIDIIKNPSDMQQCIENPAVATTYVLFRKEETDVDFNITSPKILKNAKFRIRFLTDGKGNIIEDTNNACLDKTYNCVWGLLTQIATSRYGNECPTRSDGAEYCDIPCAVECNYKNNEARNRGEENVVPTDECLKCLFDIYGSSNCSRDNFAVRPYKYIIENIPNKIKAGENFNLTIKAVDYLGNPAYDYNETIHLTNLTSPVLKYIDTNSSKGCVTGDLNGTNLNFVNGIANANLKYSEVGDLNISIKEINGSEFAKVDEKDTNESDRLITEDSNEVVFIPYTFNVDVYFKNFNDGNFTYLSNDLNMSSKLNLIIKAINKDNNVLQNYNKNCYAKNISLNSNYNYTAINPNNPKYLSYNDDKNTTITKQLAVNKVIERNITKEYFETNGLANVNIYLNYSKDYRNPVEPFNMNILNITLNDGDVNKFINTSTSNVYFVYGRIKTPNIVGYPQIIGNNYVLTDKFIYEYWKNNNWNINNSHTQAYGDVNKTSAYLNFVKTMFNVEMNIASISNGYENVSIMTSHTIPYSTKIHLSIPSWLWYHPLALDYKNPSTTNLNCLTHPCFRVSYEKSSQGWGGVGIQTKSNKYSEENRTTTTNSNIKINKNKLKKLNW